MVLDIGGRAHQQQNIARTHNPLSGLCSAVLVPGRMLHTTHAFSLEELKVGSAAVAAAAVAEQTQTQSHAACIMQGAPSYPNH